MDMVLLELKFSAREASCCRVLVVKRCGWFSVACATFDVLDAVFGLFQRRQMRLERLLVAEFKILAIQLVEPRQERLFGLALLGEFGVQCPVFSWLKGLDLFFTIHHDANRDTLHTSGRKPIPHAIPQQFGQVIAPPDDPECGGLVAR